MIFESFSWLFVVLPVVVSVLSFPDSPRSRTGPNMMPKRLTGVTTNIAWWAPLRKT